MLTSSSYAGALKKKPRSAEKNLVIVESADDSTGMTEKKGEVAKALEGVQITETRYSDKNTVMNFATTNEMNDAMTKLNAVDDLKVKHKQRRLVPKIMI
ncbi:hypothetical protein SK128_025938, partial [Halocaridina rubra]